MKTNLDIDRFRGCLLGLAVGDALGTTLEFKPPGTFEPIADMVEGGLSDSKPASGSTTLPWPCAWAKA
jgi:ADP-ribosylglycohydrolase